MRPRRWAFGASLNSFLGALMGNQAASPHYVCDPEYGGPRYEKYREETSVFLLGANWPPGDIRYSDAIETLPMSTCRRWSGRGPAHTYDLHRAAGIFGLPSGSSGETYWRSWPPPRSPWSLLLDFLLDFGVHGENAPPWPIQYRPLAPRRLPGRGVSGRYVGYLHPRGYPRQDGERAPTSGGIGIGGKSPSMDAICNVRRGSC